MPGPSSDAGFFIERIRWEGGTIVLDAEGAAAEGQCPACGTRSAYVHGRYRRQPTDLPWRGFVVRVHLTVRRFRCRVPECSRRTFAEDFGAGLPRVVRRTRQTKELLLDFVRAFGGEAGARAARATGVPVSPDTLLRLLRQVEEGEVVTHRVLGVDDFAFRRGHRYGTILVNMETHQPIDLLADREATTLAKWLKAHPGVEIITRDRAGAYAEGARAGAPDALQVADRFHLLLNASEALEELLRSRRRRTEWIQDPAPDGTEQKDEAPIPEPAVLSPTQRQRAEQRARRIARWEEVHARHAAGQNLSQIARAVGKGRKTIRRYLATSAPPPAPHVIRPRPAGLTSPTLQPYVSYLQDRWQAGCMNVRRLYRELVERGYTGSYSLLREALSPWRPPRPVPQSGPRHRRSVRWLCLWPQEKLTPEELAVRERVLAEDPELAHGCALREQFQDLIRDRDAIALDLWIARAQASGLAPFHSFANGLVKDQAAVYAALTTEWSNGLVEGHVHRLKLIKRQGYGRAKLDLLRRRVLAA